MSETYEEPLDQDELEPEDAAELAAEPDDEDEPDDDFQAHLFNRR